MPFGQIMSLATIDSLELPSIAAFPMFGLSTSIQNISLTKQTKILTTSH